MMQDKRAKFDGELIDNEPRAEYNLYELTPGMAAVLMSVTSGVMRWSTRWVNVVSFGAVLGFVSELNYRLSTPVAIDTCASDYRGAPSQHIICNNKEMNKVISIEYKSGKPYLRQDCGCAPPRYYLLAETSLDDDGDPVPAGGGGNDSSIQYPSVQSDPDCYAVAATDYLLSRAQQYVSYIASLGATALDTALSNVDEVLDIAALISNIANGDDVVDIVTGSTANVVNTEINNSRQALIDAWSYEGEINRFQLLGWVLNAPVISNGVPVQYVLTRWVTNSIIPGYNRDLAIFANECNAGNAVINPPIPISPVGDFNADGVNYTVIELPATAVTGPVTQTIQRLSSDCIALAWDLSASAASGCSGNKDIFELSGEGLGNYNGLPNGQTVVAQNAGVRDSMIGAIPNFTGGGYFGNTNLPVPAGDLILNGPCGSSVTMDYTRIYAAVRT